MATSQLATFGGGCFWCTEAVFKEVNGVQSVQSGYSGGHDRSPTYESVCGGRTGHAEVVQIQFDPNVVTFGELLEVFFNTHDPTTLNRQGNDVGTQYRSAIFYHDDEQKDVAASYIRQLDASRLFSKPIVTEVVPFEAFYPAEEYHDDYFARQPNQPYCQFVVRPKVEKFRKAFPSMLAGRDQKKH